MADDFLSEKNRAEDIILGGLGYGEGARIISIKKTSDGFTGVGRFEDGEEFKFKSDFDLGELERWALEVLKA